MKIALVYDVIYPYVVGGVQLRYWELAKRLSQRGHAVTLFGSKHWSGDDCLIKDGVRLRAVCPGHPLYTKGRRAMWPPIRFAAGLFGPLWAGDFDIIDVANFPYFPCFPAWLAALGRRSRLVMTWIEVWDAYWLTYLGAPGRLARALERRCARLPQAAAAISEMTKRDLGAIGYRQPVAVIPCGVDLAEIDAVAPAAMTTEILFVGRLIKEKNVDLLIRAVGLLAASHPHLGCAIVGDGPERAALVALADQLNLRETIRFLPPFQHHREVFAAMKSARVLANPSSREGFGIVAVEANACGLPVATTDHPRNASRDLIQPGRNGLVHAPTAPALAAALAAILGGAAATPADCRAIAEQYDWETIADALERFYLAHLATSGRAASLAAAR